MTNAEFAALVRKNPLLTGAGLLAAMLAVGIYYVAGVAEEAAAVLEQKTSEGMRLADNVKNAALLPEQLSALEADREKVEARLIRADELAKNLQYFYRIETETGVELIDIRQNTGAAPAANAKKGAPPAFLRTNFSVTLKGDYLAVLNYLRRVESGAHYCRVLSVTIDTVTVDRAGPVKMGLVIELLSKS
jgi:hypothetical protein